MIWRQPKTQWSVYCVFIASACCATFVQSLDFVSCASHIVEMYSSNSRIIKCLPFHCLGIFEYYFLFKIPSPLHFSFIALELIVIYSSCGFLSLFDKHSNTKYDYLPWQLPNGWNISWMWRRCSDSISVLLYVFLYIFFYSPFQCVDSFAYSLLLFFTFHLSIDDRKSKILIQ